MAMCAWSNINWSGMAFGQSASPQTQRYFGGYYDGRSKDNMYMDYQINLCRNYIKEIQAALNRWQTVKMRTEGAPFSTLVVDGIYGSATGNAVGIYQRRRGLGADNLVGAYTWNDLILMT